MRCASYKIVCDRRRGCHHRWPEIFPQLNDRDKTVRWRIESTASLRVATTFADSVLRPLGEMAGEWVLIGVPDRLEFSTFAGNDVVFVGLGVPIDSRWLGADLAIIRTVIGDYFDAPDIARFRFLVASIPSDSYQPDFRFHTGRRGLTIEVERGAAWDASARIDVA